MCKDQVKPNKGVKTLAKPKAGKKVGKLPNSHGKKKQYKPKVLKKDVMSSGDYEFKGGKWKKNPVKVEDSKIDPDFDVGLLPGDVISANNFLIHEGKTSLDAKEILNLKPIKKKEEKVKHNKKSKSNVKKNKIPEIVIEEKSSAEKKIKIKKKSLASKKIQSKAKTVASKKIQFKTKSVAPKKVKMKSKSKGKSKKKLPKIKFFSKEELDIPDLTKVKTGNLFDESWEYNKWSTKSAGPVLKPLTPPPVPASVKIVKKQVIIPPPPAAEEDFYFSDEEDFEEYYQHKAKPIVVDAPKTFLHYMLFSKGPKSKKSKSKKPRFSSRAPVPIGKAKNPKFTVTHDKIVDLIIEFVGTLEFQLLRLWFVSEIPARWTIMKNEKESQEAELLAQEDMMKLEKEKAEVMEVEKEEVEPMEVESVEVETKSQPGMEVENKSNQEAVFEKVDKKESGFFGKMVSGVFGIFSGKEKEVAEKKKPVEVPKPEEKPPKEPAGAKEIKKKENKIEKWGSGIGYGHSGNSKAWNVQQWTADLKKKELEMADALEVVHKELTAEVKDGLLEKDFTLLKDSCLLPFLQQWCNNDSLNDVNRHPEVYEQVFNILNAALDYPELNEFFVDCEYAQALQESVSILYQRAAMIKKVAEMDIKDPSKPNNAKPPKPVEKDLIAYQVIDCYEKMAKTFKANADGNKEDKAAVALNRENYIKLMREECFDMVEDFRYHVFQKGGGFSSYGAKKIPVRANRKLMKRLGREFADLADSLPIDPESSVFFRACENNLSYAQMLIIPADGTPYGGGCFIFDMCFPSDYPNVPPKVNLQTTGKGSVRFNPNLYECGKVCLSLLGTWGAGNQGEGWNPSISSILQVAISIQSLIFVPNPYFNEPGYEQSMNSETSRNASKAYDKVRQVGTVEWAMIDLLKNPPPVWKDIIELHFKLSKERVLANCAEWKIAEAKVKELKELLEKL